MSDIRERRELTAAATEYRRARRGLEDAREGLLRRIREACDAGVTEVEAARIAGVSRMTVRAWRGKS